MKLRRFFQLVLLVSILMVLSIFFWQTNELYFIKEEAFDLEAYYWQHYFDEWKDLTDREDAGNISISVAILNVWPYMRVLLDNDDEIWDAEFQPFTKG